MILFFVVTILTNMFIPAFQSFINVTETVQNINKLPNLKWKAGQNGLPETIQESMLKSRVSSTPVKCKSTSTRTGRNVLPHKYDWRAALPECTVISKISNQGHCGSQYAYSTVGAFQDRVCIHSKSKINTEMSVDQLLGCETSNKGCQNGSLSVSWDYIAKHGLVSSKDYKSIAGCKTPQQYDRTTKLECCDVPDSMKRYYAGHHQVFSGEDEIRREIRAHGPVTSSIRAFKSFQHYSSGIYEPIKNEETYGWHQIRIIGWGEDKGTKYWTIANSYGKEWGEKGFMKIVRGSNCGGIEEDVHAAMPAF